jgi:hypothetical protein
MWTCKKCEERLDESFPTCWNCGTQRSGVEDAFFVRERASSLERDNRPGLNCLRCPRELDYVGTKKSHEGTRWGILGELGELLVRKESFDLYVCSNCGHVEFFVNGMGEIRNQD